MDTEERLALVKQVGEEIVTEEDLRKLLEEKKKYVAYDGFEPSGQIHIAQGTLRAINVNKMIKTGCTFKMLVADWHGWANNKMGGDLDKIQTVGKYFIEVWKACGMDLDHVEFVWANDLVNSRDYWKRVLQIARSSTMQRIVRCGQIMGRKETEMLSAAQIIYPCMQAADIFELEADVCQLGMDQRKVNMLAREIGPQLGLYKPVIVSHHMLMGLTKPASAEGDKTERTIELKMSKSKPETAIFMMDSDELIKEKLTKAYCPAGTTAENPLAEYMKYIIFEKFPEITVERPEKFGGNVTFASYAEFEAAYNAGKVHPADLKSTAVRYVQEIVKPVRDHFDKNSHARELFELVKSYQVTR